MHCRRRGEVSIFLCSVDHMNMKTTNSRERMVTYFLLLIGSSKSLRNSFFAIILVGKQL
jgi:hypothetical protein